MIIIGCFVFELIIGILCLWIAKKQGYSIFNVPAAFAFIFIGMLIMILSTYKTPTAIDVYRGKTTLQITYEDSVPTDTVVIFKNDM